MTDNIFVNLRNDDKTVFKAKNYLNHRFLPDSLPHREEQIKQIAKYWVEALNDITPPDITLYGKTGTGKTAAANFAKNQLKEALEEYEDCMVDIKTAYIRCTDYTTEYQVIARLCQILGQDVPYRGWTKAEVVNAFRSIFKKSSLGKETMLIVILDEIDVLLKKDGDGILYTLTRTDNVAILSISNFIDFKQFITPRSKSSFRDREIVFPPYGADQLVDILKERVELSFKEGTVDDDVIHLCAALAAKEEGDARYALDLLKTSGEIADDYKLEKVEESTVREAKDKIEHSKVKEIIETLPSQQLRVLESILYLTKQKEEISSGKLFDVYKNIAKGDSVSYRRIFDFVSELELLGLISTNIVSRGRGKGRTNIIELQCELNILEESIWAI